MSRRSPHVGKMQYGAVPENWREVDHTHERDRAVLKFDFGAEGQDARSPQERVEVLPDLQDDFALRSLGEVTERIEWASPYAAEFVPYAAEFVGTFMLVFTAGYCSIHPDALMNTTAIAVVLMAMVYCFKDVSGGHLNPAVTLALALIGQVRLNIAAGYCLVQVAAGVCAGLLVRLLLGVAQEEPLGPQGAFGWWPAMLVEVIYTAVLCFVFANCTVSRRNNPKEDPNYFYGLAIGFVLVAGGYACGNISGAAFNPAVSFGLDVLSLGNGRSWAPWSFVYCVCHALGSAIAAGLFYLCRPDECHSNVGKSGLTTMLLCEFLGTFVLSFTVGLDIVTVSVATPWSAAAAMMCMIYALGGVSGGHFNPAVTLGVQLSGLEMRKKRVAAFYVLAQYAGAVCAGIAYATISCTGRTPANEGAGGGGSFLEPKPGYSWVQAAIAEAIFTLILVHTVLAVACASDSGSRTKHKNQAALAVGMCVAAGGFAIGNVSGGVLNPAVSLAVLTRGLSCSSGSTFLTSIINCLWFSVFQLVGGALAAAVLLATSPAELRAWRLAASRTSPSAD